MSMTDPLSDMLTRIRNGQQAGLVSVLSPFSNIREAVLKVLKDEGFIESYEKQDNESGRLELKIDLRYINGKSVINELKRVSKPGRRVYFKIREFKKFYNGLGIAILSTSKGVMSDYQARKQKVGGEVLCVVF